MHGQGQNEEMCSVPMVSDVGEPFSWPHGHPRIDQPQDIKLGNCVRRNCGEGWCFGSKGKWTTALASPILRRVKRRGSSRRSSSVPDASRTGRPWGTELASVLAERFAVDCNVFSSVEAISPWMMAITPPFSPRVSGCSARRVLKNTSSLAWP